MRERAITVWLAALALLLALIQRPGTATTDTKIDLHVDPLRFLGQVASAWSSTGDLGHVQGGQYGGYLFPMGPVLALLHPLGPWLAQRLWLALVLFLAGWGAARLMDAFSGPRAVAAVLYMVNPYVVIFTARTSITLLGYAALPWLLACTLRGLRSRPSWRWPAAFALIVTASGGGVNAAVTAWVLLGPVLLAAYELWTRAVERRAVVAFAWRTVVATALASAWWVVPLLVQSRYGADFLRFTEQPGTIWSTTSLPESLRLMGYWVSYLGVGYGGVLRPYFGDGRVLLFSTPVVLAGLLVPALALLGFAWSRRTRYAPLLLALVLAGLLVMSVGFPEGTPLRRGANFAYNHFAALQFLRTTHKAGPLVALGIAGLAGLAPRRLGLLAVALTLVAAWPLVTGRAIDRQVTWQRIPPAWRAAARHVDAAAGDGRAVVLPGQLYAYYDWGGTIDPVLPTLATKPVAVRSAVPYGDLRATDLLWTVDALVQQRRALPGQLGPLLDLLGARTVVAGADDDRSRSGAVPASDAADVLDALGRPTRAWGPVRPRERSAGTLGRDRRLPEVRAWDRPRAPGLVRLEPAAPQTVVDGSADGLAGLAALGGRLNDVAYAADLSPAAIARAREVVITDSNRRRVFVASRLAQNTGLTLAADEAPSVDAARLNPFTSPADETVAAYSGIRAVSAPSSPGFPQFPERRPFAAVDGDPSTHWQADRALDPARWVLSVALDRPRDVDHVDLLPYDDRVAAVTAVDVGGRRFTVHPGWNRLPVHLHGVSTLRVRIAGWRDFRGAHTVYAPGISELRIPGVRASEALRPPVRAERALAGRDLSHTALAYVFQRTTGDDPFRRDPRHGPAAADLVRDRGDGESGLERVFAPPAARAWAADGWATVAPDASDAALDRLAGVPGRFTSSGRFEGRPGFRASSAFDGTPRPWIGSWPGSAWLQWTRPATLRRLRLAPVAGVRRPTLVRLVVDGRPSAPLPVRGGTVTLPAPVHGRTFRLEILRAAFPPGTSGVVRQRRAVGIAEITGPGVPHVHVPRAGALRGSCGDLAGRLSSRPLRLRVLGTIDQLDAGRPLRVRGCGTVALAAGPARLSLPAGTFAPYLLRLRSGAPAPAAPAPGRVLSAGRATRGGRTGVRLDVRAPARLVLAESFNRGRRATCDGRDLGPPQVGDAYGTAWRVPAGCRDVEIAFAPDRLVGAGYIVSLVAGCGLLLVLLRRRRGPSVISVWLPGSDAPPARLPARRAALLAVPIALALGFAFAARATPVFGLAAFVILWRGIGARPLALAAGALLVVVVPVLTLVLPVRDRGGFNPSYAGDRVAVHWGAAAAVMLLVFALARTLATARVGRGARRGG